ncbi:equilibrative nucleoside transporter 1 [Glossina fuscipes]|uniref:Equilibrative nucleoside transporter 1 n=1 Tax=Glossina fuscipes TaxID=7396 RepID=A0A8U0WBV6_9MUSC|nr:equilibrative nucleoside transporter 1 [Glossina fuscipes]
MLKYDDIDDTSERCKLLSNEQLAVDDDDNDEVNFHQQSEYADFILPFAPATLPLPSETQYNEEILERDKDNDIFVSPDIPADVWNYTYFVFCLLGIATMTPWNFFITAEDYWMYKFRNVSLNVSHAELADLSPLQKSFPCYLTITASISGTSFLVLNAIFGQRVPVRLKILGTLCVILLLFAITTAFVELNTDAWQELFFALTLFIVIILNVCSAIMSGGVFGVAGLFPSEYMTAMVSGQALGGILTALTFIIVLALGAGDPTITAFTFFIVGSVLILLNIVCYAIMESKPFFQYYLNVEENIRAPYMVNGVIGDDNAAQLCVTTVFSKIYIHAVTICILFTTTLSVYPSITVLVQSESYGEGKAWNDIYFRPVANYLIFNSGDYFGRVIAGMCEKPKNNAYTVLLMVILRTFYIPLFLCCNSSSHNFLPVWIHSDTIFIVLMTTFALSNGYLANILLIMAPRFVTRREKETASSFMIASLSCGLVFGSLLSMILVQIL